MKFRIKETNEIKEITLCFWDGLAMGCDMFGECEEQFAVSHNHLPGDTAYLCTSDEYQKLVEFWACEVEHANNGGYSDQLRQLEEDELSAGGEYILDAD